MTELVKDKHFSVNDDQLDMMENSAQEIVIGDHQSACHALSMALQARKISKQAEESRKEILRPNLDYQRAVTKIAQDIQKRMDDIEDRLRDKLFAWVEKENDNPFSQLQFLVVEDGTLTLAEKWCYELLDETQLDRQYLTVNSSAITDAIKSGVRNIPGVRIFKNKQINLRVKNG